MRVCVCVFPSPLCSCIFVLVAKWIRNLHTLALRLSCRVRPRAESQFQFQFQFRIAWVSSAVSDCTVSPMFVTFPSLLSPVSLPNPSACSFNFLLRGEASRATFALKPLDCGPKLYYGHYGQRIRAWIQMCQLVFYLLSSPLGVPAFCCCCLCSYLFFFCFLNSTEISLHPW